MRRCACILLVEFRSRFGYPSDEDTAQTIINLGLFHGDLSRLKQEIAEMINAGTRYKNLEKSLGMGASLVLGVNISESMYDCLRMRRKTWIDSFRWTKTLPKGGAMHRLVVSHIARTPLPALAAQYATLRVTVVEERLRSFFQMAIHTVSVGQTFPHSFAVGERFALYTQSLPAINAGMEDAMFNLIDGNF